MAAVGSVMVEVAANVARFQSDMGKMASIAEERLSQIDKAVGIVQNSLKTVGASLLIGLSIEKIKSKIEGVIESAAGLQNIAEKAGITVEAISGLAGVAKLSGTSTEELAGGLQKLSKSMVDAENGGTKTSNTFKAIGISTDEIKRKKPDEVFQLIAQRLANYHDGAEKTVVMQNLLGKSGADLLPMMKQLAAAGELQAKVTEEQAAAAKEYEDNLILLNGAQNAVYKIVAMEVLPVMNAFTKAMLEAVKGSNGLKDAASDLAKDGSIKEFAIEGAKALGLLVDGFDLVARGGAIALKVMGGIKDVWHAVNEGQKDNAALGEQIQKRVFGDIEKILMRPQFSDLLAKQLDKLGKTAAEASKKGNINKSLLGNDNGPKDDPARKIMEGRIKAQEDFIAAELKQLQTREKAIEYYHGLEYYTLRDAEEKKQGLVADSLQQQLAAYDKEVAAIKTYMAQAAKEVDRQDSLNKLAEVAKKRAAAEVEASTKIGDAQMRIEAVKTRFDLATKERIRQDEIANETYRQQIELMGQSSLEIQKANAARQIQLQLEERIHELKKLDKNVDTSEAIAAAAAQTARATSLIEQAYNKQRDAIFGAQEALRKYAEDSANIGAQIENAMSSAFKGMEDALVDFVTKGKLDFKSLADSIVADITRIIIRQQIVGPLAKSIQGGMSEGGGLGGAIGSFFSSLFGGQRAAGGPVSAGGLYEVNERGPELLNVGGREYLMMGGQSGSVTPNASLGGATVNQVINFHSSGPVDRRTQQQIAAQAAMGAQRALARNT